MSNNIASLMAVRRLGEAADALSRVMERLSSGMRINRASDDAAGLALSTSLNSSTRILGQAIRNANDGISLLNIAEGGLNALRNISLRQLELAEQAANGTYTTKQRQALTSEANALVDEFNRIVESLSFNGRKLLDGQPETITLQLGAGPNSTLDLTLREQLARVVGTGSYTLTQTQTVGANPWDIVSGDFNGDGIMDLADSDNNSGSISISIGNGDGTFKARVSYTSGGGPLGMAAVDFNRDGILDLVSANESTDAVNILIGNGDGTFKATVTYTVGDVPRKLITDDFNGDGIIDIATASETSNDVNILLGNGNGTFRSGGSYQIGDYNSGVEFDSGDLNGDGYIDILVPNRTQGTVSVLLGNGNGTFRSQTTVNIGAGTLRIDSARLEDINLDGYLDLIMAENNVGQVLVYHGNGDGSFKYSTAIPVANLPRSLRVADLNGDGIDDFALSIESGNSVGVILGNRDGTFTAVTTFAVGATPRVVGVADLNGDGVLDIIGGNTLGASLSIYIAQTEEVTTTPLLNLSSREDALASISIIRGTLERVSNELANVGALQSRLGFALNHITIMRENYIAAGSRILDADIAQDAAEMIRLQILQNAAAAVLAQANQEPKIALTLLQSALEKE